MTKRNLYSPNYAKQQIITLTGEQLNALFNLAQHGADHLVGFGQLELDFVADQVEKQIVSSEKKAVRQVI